MRKYYTIIRNFIYDGSFYSFEDVLRIHRLDIRWYVSFENDRRLFVNEFRRKTNRFLSENSANSLKLIFFYVWAISCNKDNH